MRSVLCNKYSFACGSVYIRNECKTVYIPKPWVLQWQEEQTDDAFAHIAWPNAAGAGILRLVRIIKPRDDSALMQLMKEARALQRSKPISGAS